MIKYMKIVAQYPDKLVNDERNLLSVAYKNSVKTRRDAWRTIQAIHNKEELKNNKFLNLIVHYKEKIENELRGICQDVLDLLDNNLISNPSNDAEAIVFYQKMKGDYYRYLGEFLKGADQKEVIEKALESYKKATEEASKLMTTHPIRLGLALNFSVFYYEILNQADVACKLAKSAFDAAISDLESLEEEQYRDSATIMQLLRDNLTLWTSDLVEGAEGSAIGDDE